MLRSSWRRSSSTSGMAFPRSTSSKRGQAFVETAIAIIPLILLMLGVVEVGWAFMRSSMIEHSARDGARYGATLAGTVDGNDMRDMDTGCLTGSGAGKIRDRVEDQLDTVGFEADTIEVCQSCDGTIPLIEVTINGTMEMLFNVIPIDFPVERPVTFQDESRVCPDNACGCS
jgi:hypothetical protein